VLKQPLRAFDLYEKTFKQTNRSELLPTLRRLGNLTEAQQPERVRAMRERVIEGLRSRIEMSWDAPDQITSLIIIAAIEGEDRGDLEAERAIANEALAMMQARGRRPEGSGHAVCGHSRSARRPRATGRRQHGRARRG
jgi:hypothetical protein